MRQIIYSSVLFFLLVQAAAAQEGDEAFAFLRYPSSARANALGGNNISVVERDPSLIFHNPALLGAEMDGMVSLGYMNFVSDINTGSALYTKAIGEKGAWGAGVTYINYGSFKKVNVEGIEEGSFSVNDISLNAFYARDLSERWRGGLTMKFLYSAIADYTSIGLAVDAGLSYYDSEKEFSFGVALKNIGAQLKAYDDDRQKVPWDIQMGISKEMAHAPFRFHLTAMHLNKWEMEYIDATGDDDGDTFFQTFAKHLVLGVDYIPTENFWLGLGFNPKTNMDMKLEGGNALAGFSAGAGIRIRMFDVGVSVAKYHPSALSLLMNVSLTLGELKP